MQRSGQEERCPAVENFETTLRSGASPSGQQLKFVKRSSKLFFYVFIKLLLSQNKKIKKKCVFEIEKLRFIVFVVIISEMLWMNVSVLQS